jgi:hypothetical protein
MTNPDSLRCRVVLNVELSCEPVSFLPYLMLFCSVNQPLQPTPLQYVHQRESMTMPLTCRLPVLNAHLHANTHAFISIMNSPFSRGFEPRDDTADSMAAQRASVRQLVNQPSSLAWHPSTDDPTKTQTSRHCTPGHDSAQALVATRQRHSQSERCR